MHFRMMFLLKSHVRQKKPKDLHQYDGMLCILAGRPVRKFTGEGHLLEHVFHHQYQVFGEVPLVGPLSIETDGVKAECFGDFDILFDRAEGFALPPSMLEENRSFDSVPLDLPAEVFGNVWAH